MELSGGVLMKGRGMRLDARAMHEIVCVLAKNSARGIDFPGEYCIILRITTTQGRMITWQEKKEEAICNLKRAEDTLCA